MIDGVNLTKIKSKHSCKCHNVLPVQQYNTPIIPATQEAETGGWLVPRSLRPTWTTQRHPFSKKKKIIIKIMNINSLNS
jgi:hypothetical protein